MSYGNTLLFACRALLGSRTRTIFMLIAMAIGVAAVMVLTSLGEGARRYVTGEFTSLGTNLLIVLPGRSETAGFNPASLLGTTPRDLTLDDAAALLRHGSVRRIAPINVGTTAAKWRGKEREATIIGSNADLLDVRRWEMAGGRFLPRTELTQATPVCVIGQNIRRELFGAHKALGEWLRLGERRFRVIGIIGSEGRSIGVDVQETIIIPVASAQALFNAPSLFRVLVEAKSRATIPSVKQHVIDIVKQRHQGEEDITVITQDSILKTFDRILKALTMALAGIAAISLGVAGILIMNVMLVAVSQRTTEIGLLKALGATRQRVLLLFLTEASILSLIGALIGLTIGQLGSWLIRIRFPDLPAYVPLWAIMAAMGIAVLTGALFSILPARKAARQDPVLALSRR